MIAITQEVTVCETYFISGGGSDVGGSGNVGGNSSGGGDSSSGGGWQDDPCAPAPPLRTDIAACNTGDPGWVAVPPLADGGNVPQFDPNYPFSNIDAPIDVPDDPILNSSLVITDDITASDPTGVPRVIAQTQNRNNTEDMQSGTNGDATGIISSELQKTDNALFDEMSSLFHWCTYFDNDLQNVGNIMIQKFRDKTGGTFENPTLNEKVASSSALYNFVIKFAGILENKLEVAGGNIDNVTNINLGTIRPVFNGLYNKFHGLQILINDTEYTEISLDGFRIGSDGKRTAIITLTIHDHFGLDKNDALSYQSSNEGFAAWWILQHKRAYKPFETIIHVKKKLEWAP